MPPTRTADPAAAARVARAASRDTTMPGGSELLLEVRDLRTHLRTDDGVIRAVDGVDLAVHRGRTLGIVGESGCGKTILCRSIIRTVPEPPAEISGNILWHRKDASVVDLASCRPNGNEIRSIRGKEIAMIFQEPMRSLSPVHTIGNQVAEALLAHEKVAPKDARAQAIDMLVVVGIPNAKAMFHAYPFELSGGMRQRAMIAMALMCHPDLLIADEPSTALDVTVEAAILRLLKRLQARMGMSIMIITHDLGVVATMADDVVVMYLGQVVEQGPVETIFANPQHPYTQALMRSMPRIGAGQERLAAIRGSVPDPYAVIPGCSFSPRCPEAEPGRCNVHAPHLIEMAPGHSARCLLREGGAK